MEHFTPGPWRVSGFASIIADAPHEGTCNNQLEVDDYGGYMVAESVKAVNAPLISAAPDMFAMLEKLVECIDIRGLPRVGRQQQFALSIIEAAKLLEKIREE